MDVFIAVIFVQETKTVLCGCGEGAAQYSQYSLTIRLSDHYTKLYSGPYMTIYEVIGTLYDCTLYVT